MPGRFLLRRALHRRYPRQIAPDETPIDTVCEWLCDEISEVIANATEGLQLSDVGAHFVCSTCVDRPFSGGILDWEDMRQRIGKNTPFVPETMVNAYECASWGYVLRYIAQMNRVAPYIVLHVVDVNAINLSMWVENENWGKSGFGITTLLFELQGDEFSNVLRISASKTPQRIAEFTVDVRKEALKRPGVSVALPFFPRNVTEVLERSLAGTPRLADLHPQLGHCFGSDPWLGIIDAQIKNPEARRYLATSVALIGYWAIAEIETCADGIYRFEEKLT